ncbi:hypothetical protein FQN57_000827 [Myotisia sp. PD_48]|nr:hypothetical protein FQN57_000827 [Myotisia sp. PD_48]
MASQIHLVRHAESTHNVSKDFSQLDPGLTPLGIQQAAQLGQTFPHLTHVRFIVASPLRRTIETTLIAFTKVLDKRYFDPLSENGVENGATLILEPDLQERSNLPCDTGSSTEVLEERFPGLDFKGLPDGWQVKQGQYGSDDEAVEQRARRVRNRIGQLVESDDLVGKEKNHIIIVTHGVFMKFLSGEPEIDLPKAGWKSYTAKHLIDGVQLVPV